jgi:hypothetical protein
MLKHNKKRNIGLLNEFFAQYIASAVVNFRYDNVDKAKNLWRKHVANNKELGQELKLFETLYSTKLNDRNVAFELLKKVKTLVCEQDQQKIDAAKTRLLHEINSQLEDSDFFGRPVENYKTNATIQILMNTWRNNNEKSLIFSEISRLEDQIINHIVDEKQELPPFDAALLNQTKEDIDKLVVNVFREKMDSKYSQTLNEEQKKLVGLYVFSTNQDEAKQQLVEVLTNLREKTLLGIEKELKAKDSKTPVSKLEEAQNCLSNEYYDVNNPSDDTITFYLGVCNLKHELESE